METIEYDDLGEALREGRRLRAARSYRIRFAVDGVDFRPLHVAEAMPTGAHILAAAELNVDDAISLFAILASGDFEEVLLGQRFDLHGRGAERFLAFRTDRLFKLTLNRRQLQWGRSEMPASALYELARVGEGDAIFLEGHGGGRRLVERDELFDLAAPGVEHFLVAPVTFEIIVNSRPRTVTDRKVTFEEVVQFAYPGAQPSTVVFSMTYRHAASQPHAGELAVGGVVHVKNGTVFNVARTVQS